jgi:aryl-alcohol dehydrogenase-like predicted oxidoreductase
MLLLASNQGMGTLDTAISYGDSEKRLGEIGTNGFKIITKLTPILIDCADVSSWVEKQVAISMGYLGVTSIEGPLMHRWS